MTPRGRGLVLGIGLAGTALPLLAALIRLAPTGQGASAYGDTINRVAPYERQVTDTVAAVNFDYRGFDTMGEETILFAAVLGVVVLLRDRQRAPLSMDERSGHAQPPSEAVRVVALAVMGATVAFGVYVIAHGQVTPGGGFQGGVILSTAPVLAYLATRPAILERIAPEALARMAEAVGIGGYVALGFAGLLTGRAFLANVLPLGQRGDVLSSGTIFALNLVTGLAVSAGFIYVVTAFLEKARQTGPGEGEEP